MKKNRGEMVANVNKLLREKESFETISTELQMRLLETLMDCRDLLSPKEEKGEECGDITSLDPCIKFVCTAKKPCPYHKPQEEKKSSCNCRQSSEDEHRPGCHNGNPQEEKVVLGVDYAKCDHSNPQEETVLPDPVFGPTEYLIDRDARLKIQEIIKYLAERDNKKK